MAPKSREAGRGRRRQSEIYVTGVGGRRPAVPVSPADLEARDMAIALALGAKAVLVGRPYVYGLAIAGEQGVTEVIRNLVAEFDTVLALVGLARGWATSMQIA